MSVDSDLVRETVVRTICERALGRAGDPPPQRVAAVLGAAEHPDLARRGYLARIVETELFEPARDRIAWLEEELATDGDNDATWAARVAGLAGTLADREPRQRPDPGDRDAVTWRVPGPGGHVRHYVAMELTGSGHQTLKRDVIYGFLVRCCEEATPTKP